MYLEDAQTCPPLLQHQQLSLRVGCCSDDGVHLVGFEVFRYAPLALEVAPSYVLG